MGGGPGGRGEGGPGQLEGLGSLSRTAGRWGGGESPDFRTAVASISVPQPHPAMGKGRWHLGDRAPAPCQRV